MLQKMTIFDCTLREAGYQTGWHFDDQFCRDAYKYAQGKNVDYLELGFYHSEDHDPNRGALRYTSNQAEKINSIFEPVKNTTKLSSMRDIQRPLSPLIPKADTVVDAVRILTRSNETDFKELGKHVEEIQNLGYECFINFTSAGYNPIGKNVEFAQFAKKIGVDVIYFADTESVFTPEFISKTMEACSAEGVEVGMHLHDKTGNAEMLLEVAIGSGCRYTDATLMGLGGKFHDGNLTMEHLLRRFGIPLGYEMTKLKTQLIQQIIKYNEFTAAVL